MRWSRVFHHQTPCTRILLSLLLLTAAAFGQSKPNIIFFLVDDLGYGDLGCFWQDQRASTKKFDTPALDTMAAQGAKLTHHYVSASVCAPSRASLLQGRHQGHCDVRNSQFDKALPDTHIIAIVLKAAGYRTIHIGKDGLAGAEASTNLTGTGSQNLAAHPLARGFDRFFGYLFHADGHEHYPRNGTTDKVAHIYDDYRQVTDASLDLYTTDAWTAAAKKEIIDEATDGDDQPFFLYLAYDTPHFKMQRPAVAYPALDNDGNPLTGGIQWTTATDGSGKVRYASTANGTGVVDAFTHPDIPSGWADSEKQHVGMIRRIDESIADILRTLQDLGIDNNTLCVFSSDNGPHNEGNNPRTFQSFANMEGIKRDMWEAGIRVPTIVRWPGQIAGATGNENNIHEIAYPSAHLGLDADLLRDGRRARPGVVRRRLAPAHPHRHRHPARQGPPLLRVPQQRQHAQLDRIPESRRRHARARCRPSASATTWACAPASPPATKTSASTTSPPTPARPPTSPPRCPPCSRK